MAECNEEHVKPNSVRGTTRANQIFFSTNEVLKLKKDSQSRSVFKGCLLKEKRINSKGKCFNTRQKNIRLHAPN